MILVLSPHSKHHVCFKTHHNTLVFSLYVRYNQTTLTHVFIFLMQAKY